MQLVIIFICLYDAETRLICQPSYRSMCELTSMQAACWFGRSGNATLGGVAAHLYAEFDGQFIDLQKLHLALQRLYREHSILRLSLNADGLPNIMPEIPQQILEVDDFSKLSDHQTEHMLVHKREQWTHQKLDLSQGQTARFSVSVLKQNTFRFHVDTDMIAIDPSSFLNLMEDLSLFYEDAEISFSRPPHFFDWYQKIRTDPELKKLKQRDRLWWKQRLPHIPPAPSLPFIDQEFKTAKSVRLSTWLSPQQRTALQQLARKQHLTVTNLILGLFAYTLGHATQDHSFRLNIPTFWREPALKNIKGSIGDFANLVILNVDLKGTTTLAAFCKQIANQMLELLEHSHYPGVNVLRDLSRYQGSAQIAPVVFTAALDLENDNLLSDRVRGVFGAMNWVISQGPQVALDAQIAHVDDGILVNWDIRLDALPKEWITNLFNSFIDLLKNLAAHPEQLNAQIISPAKNTPSDVTSQKPLNALQQAYLLGRTQALPLGGVAMQEFRQYHGQMDMGLLRQRLTEMVRRHDSLRSYIDKNSLIQYVSDQVSVNLKEIDLSTWEAEPASHHIQSYKNSYTHELFDLNQSPWNITIFLLKNNLLTIFVCFDALILDGRSIAALMLELFDGQQHDIQTQIEGKEAENSLSVHQSDRAYWERKFSRLSAIPALPWKMPLQHLTTSRYQRNTLIIEKDQFKQLSKIGAKHSLFKNSILMAIILEVLSHWSTEKSLCVAVPTLPLYAGPFSNSSTFIAVEWKTSDQFAEQANRLQTDVLEGLQHLSFSGVDLARLLFEKVGVAPVLPIVITNGLSWPVLPESHPIQQHDGLTQTPQVAIDIRFSTSNDGALIFDIDYAQEAFPPHMIDDFLKALQLAIKQIIGSEIFSFDLSNFFSELENNRSYFNHNESINRSIPHENNAKPHNQLLDIYLDVIGQAPNQQVDKSTHFTHLGLRPHHLKVVSKRIHETYAIQLSPLQLIQCRNIADVEKLLTPR
ncbi:condensation domain-containing protein [Acinetobacter courvalinii]|uniref:Condensation domain-containing protein n=1 Tax=Acinetobacter courvalinii TaxID=280147 RepID=A0AA42LD47_9GAMM|nr:condensation domain-containing protein [Acinetobacter courvalinii]MDH0562390.1 condensation domain-containing protein [Acinetobacter courvalinii]